MKNAKDSKDIKTEIENNREFWIISSQNNDDPLMIFRKKIAIFSHFFYSKWSFFYSESRGKFTWSKVGEQKNVGNKIGGF